MKVSGFTVIRNAEIMGYPVIASIKSLLPLVDEMIVGVGQSDDNTKNLIQSIDDPKIKIFDSLWDTKNTSGGLILSEKTNEALGHCSYNWCIYIQADEVLHENDHPIIQEHLKKYENTSSVEGLLSNWIHFYGSYDVIATNRKWYRNEIRIIKKNSGAKSHGDAQGFRINNRKLKVLPSGGRVFHYGWVKPPEQMAIKNKLLNRWWHGNKKDNDFQSFQYDKQYGLKKFQDIHPKIMTQLIAKQNWTFPYKRSWHDWALKDLNLWASDQFEKIFHYRIGEYKPYQLLKQTQVQNEKRTN